MGKSGNSTIDLGSTLKFIQGVNHFFENETSALGPKMQAKKQEVHDALSDSRGTFVLVIAYTGRQDLATEVRKPLDELLAKLNDDDSWVSLQILRQKELHSVSRTTGTRRFR